MSSLDNPTRRPSRWRLHTALLAGAFLLGFVPMWITARERTRERDEAQSALRVSALQNSLANAAIDARRKEYEPARQAASEFFTKLQTETERGDGSALTEAQRNSLRPLFNSRDDTITLLARSDAAAADRLADLYNKYRQATGGPPPR